MGTFMTSASFRRPAHINWSEIKPKIEAMYQDVDGLVSNLDQEKDAYAIVSPHGDLGMFLQGIPQAVTQLTGDYAVLCACVDSDFALLELYHNGQLLEESVLGRMDMGIASEVEAFAALKTPALELWEPLLLNAENRAELLRAFTENAIFVEDQLIKLSDLTGIPIFDDTLVCGVDF